MAIEMTKTIPQSSRATNPEQRAASLAEVFRLRARNEGRRLAYAFLADGEREAARFTYGELDRAARAIAAALQRATEPGERALLVFPQGLDFIAAFVGCLYAGVIAVPAHPPQPERLARTLPRLQAIARDAGPAVVLSSGMLARTAPALLAGVPELAGVPVIAIDAIDLTDARAWREPALCVDTLAFLQYTSGSTAAPRGVMVSHGNLLYNLARIRAAEDSDASSVGVSWLPSSHDMGLIEGMLTPAFGAYPAYLMPPAAFLQRPLCWLAAISRYRGTTSGGPNFAYDLCRRRVTPEERQGLDLRSWRVAYSGAEPVRAQTLEGFAETFSECGFDTRALRPVYGLAEATLLVTASDRQAPVPMIKDFNTAALERDEVLAAVGAGAARFISCGTPVPGTEVVIADPKTCRCKPGGEVGEIWVSGGGVARGYWNRSEETERVFLAQLADGGGPFLRTGDLGFVAGGELYVTGRLKDLIIVRGRKLYPQDLELTAERCHPALRPGCVAAFATAGAEAEGIALLAEVDAVDGEHLNRIIGDLRQAVAEQHEVQLAAVALLPRGMLPKTSSGKLMRHACRNALLDGSLEVLVQWTRAAIAVV